jgi:hypothetical protein
MSDNDSLGMKTSADEICLGIVMEAAIEANFETYGTLPICRRCTRGCPQYNAKGLTRFVCERSPGWDEENRRLNAA